MGSVCLLQRRWPQNDVVVILVLASFGTILAQEGVHWEFVDKAPFGYGAIGMLRWDW